MRRQVRALSVKRGIGTRGTIPRPDCASQGKCQFRRVVEGKEKECRNWYFCCDFGKKIRLRRADGKGRCCVISQQRPWSILPNHPSYLRQPDSQARWGASAGMTCRHARTVVSASLPERPRSAWRIAL